MKTKKLLEILGIVGTGLTIFGLYYQWQINDEDWQRVQEDWAIFDKGYAIDDEYYQLSDEFLEGTISKQDYVLRLQELAVKYQAHLDEIDSRLWEEDAIGHRKSMSLSLDMIKREIQRYSDST